MPPRRWPVSREPDRIVLLARERDGSQMIGKRTVRVAERVAHLAAYRVHAVLEDVRRPRFALGDHRVGDRESLGPAARP